MTRLLKSLQKVLLQVLLVLAYLLLFRWLGDLIALLRHMLELRRRRKYVDDHRRGRPLRCTPRCATVPPAVYKRADPLIYSQGYLLEQGLAVTWDNPDIQLYENGVPVSSSALKPGTTYDVEATIYNNSTEAPAVGMPVEFSFQSFGVGAVLTPIGTKSVNLPVKGAPGHPVRVKQVWTTPRQAGHYCLKVNLVWPDDANPKNNLGQENTDVVAATSPAVARFPVRNDDTIPKRIRMTADAYRIPEKQDCRRKPRKEDSDREHPVHRGRGTFIPPSEERADWTLARVRHDPDRFPVPDGWRVAIVAAEFDLEPGASREVTVTITPPEDFSGQRPFNINAMHGRDLLGGVTLIVTREVRHG